VSNFGRGAGDCANIAQADKASAANANRRTITLHL
jgi:hypothetical protein